MHSCELRQMFTQKKNSHTHYIYLHVYIWNTIFESSQNYLQISTCAARFRDNRRENVHAWWSQKFSSSLLHVEKLIIFVLKIMVSLRIANFKYGIIMVIRKLTKRTFKTFVKKNRNFLNSLVICQFFVALIQMSVHRTKVTSAFLQ